MKYTIQVNCTTGDSESSWTEIRDLDLAWNDLNIAKENLQRIKEHYEYYRLMNKDYRYTPNIGDQESNYYKPKKFFDEAKKLASNQRWYDKKNKLTDTSLVLELDNGTTYTYHTFWCGYFESLNSAEIVLEMPSDDGMKIEF